MRDTAYIRVLNRPNAQGAVSIVVAHVNEIGQNPSGAPFLEWRAYVDVVDAGPLPMIWSRTPFDVDALSANPETSAFATLLLDALTRGTKLNRLEAAALMPGIEIMYPSARYAD